MELNHLLSILSDYGVGLDGLLVYECPRGAIVVLPSDTTPYFLSDLTEKLVHPYVFSRLGF